jgi:type 1 glutamine amidotransferase
MKRQSSSHRKWIIFAGFTVILLLVLSTYPDRSYSGKRSDDPSNRQKLRLLIFIGGHDFEEKEFFRMFNEMEGVTWTHVRYQHDAERNLRPENSGSYDVAVFYDMHQNHETHYQDWLKVLERGKPSIFLHHALGSYVNWDSYGEIVGGRANFGGKVVKWAPNSTFKHDVNFKIHIADPNHPITNGLRDFEIFDETYNNFAVNPGVHVLLTTDHPTSGKVIAWAHRYKNSPVVYIQLGHGPEAYNNPNYRTLVARSIRWVAGR